jgi:uncharacterized lipoprotein YddW (UPF0748 family)
MQMSIQSSDRRVRHGLVALGIILASAVGVRAFSSRTPAIEYKAASPEVRATWIYVGKGSKFSNDPATGRQEVITLVDKLADANFNLLLPWVRSEYATALEDPAYQKGEPLASWDPLQVMISEAQRRGMKVHLWFAFTVGKSPAAPEFDPAKGGDPSWAARRVNELVPDVATGKVKPMVKIDACPQHPGERQFDISMINRLLDRYPYITGVHIEEPGYRFPVTPAECVCDLCQSLFRSQYGKDLISNINSKEADDFRSQATTAFIQALRQDLNARPGSPTLSVNGGYSSVLDRHVGRDWLNWNRVGLLDFYAAQEYTPNPNTFRVMTKRVVGDMSPLPVLSGIAVQWSHSTGGMEYNNADTAIQEVNDSRSYGAKGQVFYWAQALSDDLLRALKSGPYSQPAPLPSYVK